MNIYDQIHENMPTEDLTGSFIAACHVGDLNALKSLLETPKFEKHINVHFNNDLAFKWAIFNKRIEVIEYLIMEYKIDKTETIMEYLNSFKKENISSKAIKLFETIELNDALNKNLIKNQSITKKIKL
jgi:hypothetical protein